jgi:hypothetical protein
MLFAVALSMVAFGTGLLTLGLPDEPGGPAYYDGDDDDAGMVPERVTVAPQPAVVHAPQRFACHESAGRAAPRATWAPPPDFRSVDLLQRAPPADVLV